jgi:putative transcriptional regulator
MPTKRKSGRLSRASKAANKRPRRSRVARDIIAGLKEAAAFMRGEIALPARMVHIPDPVDVRAIREKTGLSQSEFARRYGFSSRTLQEWEQSRAQPDVAVRAYLTVIERNPKAVEQALADR